MEKHLDIKEGQISNSKTAKNYFWPFPFSFPMYDPYNTGPMSSPILSPAGGWVMPRRNPYYPKPTNPMLNPYNAQYRQNTWPVVQPLMMSPYGVPGRSPMGPFGPPTRRPSDGYPGGMRPRGPMGPPPRGPMGPHPRGPMGPIPGGYNRPSGPPPAPWPGANPWYGTYGPIRA